MNIRIKKDLLNKYQVTDNPLTADTLSGPSHLIRNKDKLFCIYEIKNMSINSLEKVFVQLTETKLNYPSKCLNYLIIKDIPGKYIKSLEEKFDRLIVENDLIKESLFSESRNLTDQKTIKNTQRKFNENKYIVYQENLNYIKTVKNWGKSKTDYSKKFAKAKYHSWLFDDKERIARARIYQTLDSNIIIGKKNIDNKVSDIIDIKPFYSYAILNDFNIDNKKIEFDHFSPKLIAIDKEPYAIYDPLKPIRLLSGAGWIVSSQSDSQRIEEKIKIEGE